MCKKIFFLLFLSELLCPTLLMAQWTYEKSPSTNSLNSIHFGNGRSGWVVGDKGTILYNVGDYWIEYQKITEEDLLSVFMFEGNESGWAVGSNGVILNFDGQRWKNFPSPTNKDLYSVSFTDPENGIAVGLKGAILVYDKGLWSIIDKKIVGNLYAVAGNSDYTFIGGGLECRNIPIMKIAGDLGRDVTISFDPFITIRSIARTVNNKAWAVGTRGSIFRFDGTNWTHEILNGENPSLLNVWFSDENKGITVGCSGTILLYSVKGWEKQNSPETGHLKGATIAGNKYYAVGEKGTIISFEKNQENNLTAVKKRIEKQKIDTYPNPADANLNIIIPPARGSAAKKLTITDLYGKVIMQQKIETGSGEYAYNIGTSGLNNGIYVIQVFSDKGEIASGKFLIKH